MKTSAKFHVTYYTDSELFYSSYLFTALSTLADEGFLELNYRIPKNEFSNKEIQCSRILVTEKSTGKRKLIGFDWSDSPRLIYKNKLDTCDYYFKRNLIPEVTFTYCSKEHQSKIFPLGLTFPCRSKRERPLWVRIIGAYYKFENRKMDSKSFGYILKKMIYSIQTPITLMEESLFLPSNQERKKNTILFQTRAYDPNFIGNPHDSKEITFERAEIIRTLKHEFGNDAIAGFTPSDYACRVFPELVIYENIENRKYLDLEKKVEICIYSRGLNDSPAFKLGEYLAAGSCIVSQRIPTLLPKPLTDGVELAYFDSVDHLLELCHCLLASVELRETLRKNAFNYYLQEVRPAARIMKVINEVFNA